MKLEPRRPLLPWVGILLGSAALGGWALGAPAQPEAHRSLRGTVFEDANANGWRDPGERGLPGVGVSDQATVATTGADGAYELAATLAADVVFVSVPDGWSAAGTFWRPLAGGSGEQPIDFPLRPRPLSADFTFVHASDPHLSPQSLPRLRRMGERVERLKPAFVLLTGDLVRDSLRVPESEARGYFELVTAKLARFTVPVWTVPGNHDIFGIERHLSLVSPQNPLYGKKMYRHFLGPDYYSFTWGGVRFLGLDTVDFADLSYYGHLDAAQLAWLQHDLAGVTPGSPVVTFNHIPLATAVDGLWGYTEEPPAPSVVRVDGKGQYRNVVSNPQALLELLRPFRLEVALGGHMHTRESLVFEAEGRRLRFHQAAAIVGPLQAGGMTMPSGITLYHVRDGKVDDGTFVPLD